MPSHPHQPTHDVISQHIGAGLVRTTCTKCNHIALAEADNGTAVGTAVVPAWMQVAADRFGKIVDNKVSLSTI